MHDMHNMHFGGLFLPAGMLLLALLCLQHLYIFTKRYIHRIPSRNIEISEWKSVDQEGSRVLAFCRLDVTASAPRRAGKGRGGRTRRQEQDTHRNANVSRRIQSPLSHFLKEDATLQNTFSQEYEEKYKIVFTHPSKKNQRPGRGGRRRDTHEYICIALHCRMSLLLYAYLYYMHLHNIHYIHYMH